jgi:outer membrane receptor for ferrienterochelin and colicins
MRKFPQIRPSCAVAVFPLILAGAANAQSIDYGTLQQLFDEPVTTSANGSPQRSTEAPADMQIITADDIRRSGATDIPSVLSRVAGIDVLNFSAGQSDVNVRGYDQANSPRLLVLVNGRQVYLDHYGLTFWRAIPVQMSEIRQIEVVKGPNSALFGFNAVSGVVNIITYNPEFDKVNTATATVGTHGESIGSLVSTFKLGSHAWARISAGGFASKEWAATNNLPTASDLHDPRAASAAADVIDQLTDTTELRVEASWANVQQDTDSGDGYSVDKPITASGKATLTSETPLGEIQAQAYQNQLTAKYFFSGEYDWHNTITVGSFQDLFMLGTQNKFRFGVEYRDNSLNVQPLNDGKVSYDIVSASGMWNWAITSTLTSTLALREDSMQLHRIGTFPARIPFGSNSYWDNRTLSEPSANFTLSWRPDEKDSIRLAYARGVQVPSLIELGGLELGVQPAPGYTIDLIGNPDLKPTIVTNEEVMYDHTFTALKVGVRVFTQDWRDLKSSLSENGLDILPTATTDGAITDVNASNSKMTGGELILSGSLAKNLDWHADYSGTNVTDSPFPGMDPVTRSVAFQETTPKYRGNLGLDWSGGPWEADANLHYVGKFQFYSLVNGALQPIKAYSSMSGRLGYDVSKDLTLAISGQNLLEPRQNQTGGLEVDREIAIAVTRKW